MKMPPNKTYIYLFNILKNRFLERLSKFLSGFSKANDV